ncbi:MAG: flap endonuclease-1 [Nanoarchaeota archaeon]|nr:flap endonuclease-1 [Nanoarchaeota archaeon]MBU4352746.1 flap endonuclease-1 [Nanoarchaeota archaeon]MCG2719271.1 flap endonuclease-1 [Nanoarchaeota archaeon]
MGVKLTELVPKEELSWEKLNNKVLALDASNVIYQFVSSIRQPDGTPLKDKHGNITSHLVGLFSRTTNLLTKGLKPAFVFDGKPPKLKQKEIERRKAIKSQAKEKYKQAKEDEDEASMLKYSRQVSKLTPDMIKEAKELVKALGLPVIQAPSEAEAQAAYICRKKNAWAVASQDYDCLLFKAPRLIQNLTLAEKRKLPGGGYVKVYPQLLELSKVLESLEIDHDQLLVLGILVGTDFNPGGIKGIGPKKALKLIQEEKPFEMIFEELKPDFDWKEIFDLFKNMPVTDDYSMEFNDIDEEKVKEILVEKHDFSVERVENTLNKINEDKSKGQTSLLSFG